MTTNPHTSETDGRRRQILLGATAALGSLVAGLAGCGGGGDDADAPGTMATGDRERAQGGIDSGGTGRPVARYFGAIIDKVAPLTVNGVSFLTGGASISDGDGRVLDPHALLPGMTGRIEAERASSGTSWQLQALVVQVAEQLRGPVATVDLAGASFTALEQRVVVTAQTLFGPGLEAGLPALAADRPVQVWGQLDRVGARIVATRIDQHPDADIGIVRGVLTAIDLAQGLVTIGTLRASAAHAPDLIVHAHVAVGEVVRAQVSRSGPAWRLDAIRADRLRLPDEGAVEVDGRVTRFESPQRFTVDGVEVDARAAQWTGSLQSLASGARVAVRGRAQQGVLRADTVAVEPDEPVELEGLIASADAARRTFVLNRVTVIWSDATTFEGGSSRLLTARRHVSVLGRWSADRKALVARHIHVEA